MAVFSRKPTPRALDWSTVGLVYIGAVVPVFWWGPSPWDYLAALVLAALLGWLSSRLYSYRCQVTYWQSVKVNTTAPYSYADVRRFLGDRRDSYEPGSREWLAVDLLMHALRDANTNSVPLAADRVRSLHREFKIYGECGHRHHACELQDENSGVLLVDEVGLVCADGFLYSVCRECCAPGAGGQSLACEETHDKGRCWPCNTIRALDGSAVADVEAGGSR